MIGATHVPEIVIWPLTASMTTHVNNAAAAEAIVLTKANAATPLTESNNQFLFKEKCHTDFAAFADPALKPIQPTHNKQVPRTVNGRL